MRFFEGPISNRMSAFSKAQGFRDAKVAELHSMQGACQVVEAKGDFNSCGLFFSGTEDLSVAPPAEPRGEKKLFFVQILGGENF